MERDYKTYEQIAKWMNTFCGEEFFEIDKDGFYFEDYANEWKWKEIFELIIDWHKLNKPVVSNRLSAVEMAEWFHNNYEEISKETGWETQDKCKVDFKDLPIKNKETMIKVCERWLNGC